MRENEFFEKMVNMYIFFEFIEPKKKKRKKKRKKAK